MEKSIFKKVSLILLIFTLFHVVMVFYKNGGTFVFALDDPYIHLELARNLQRGHYGINKGEYSSPSSSILWPFLLVPVAHNYVASVIYILCINFLATLGTLWVIYKFLLFWKDKYHTEKGDYFYNFLFTFLIASIFFFDMVPMIFTGMEHSLQVFLVGLVFLGMIEHLRTGEIKWYFTVALLLAPLVRYENLAITIPVIGVLAFGEKKWKLVSWVLIFYVVTIGGFSLFLHSLGLPPLPQSVIVKSSLLDLKTKSFWTAPFYFLLYKLYLANYNSAGILTIIITMFLIYFIYLSSIDFTDKERLFLQSVVVSIILHIIFGKFGWYYRYERYIILYGVLALLYGISKVLKERVIEEEFSTQFRAFVLLITLMVAFPLVIMFITIFDVCNEIYSQQYQLSRFVKDYYKKSVAVNDLGLISYLNDNYVLDLWGLGNSQAWQERKQKTANWMDQLVRKKGIKLIMIYDEWFQGMIPKSWIRIATLHLKTTPISVAATDVAFYVTDQQERYVIYNLFKKFIPTLPPNATLRIP